ncbi:Oidioi.mRNA.OKI2018_I69.PAR.g9675.t1.cds [Oikopleura dioica]|uniref:Oidioi.mRNA.OKI2018_I69.PAR.g9675.t1.cds n=1 Tax=Oikopleura dioica TaxID=34765 RepID=A0ABN7RR44_OIKDI|nr:Oidioi.mRNA.OKI2018_I69.PAR.g9675.t1.cds [Oikopleura dioica]
MGSLKFFFLLHHFSISQKVLKKKPHVIFVLVDDLGFDDVGYVNKDVHSPNIDALAKDALHLKNYYNQPSCTPSRAALMTGRYNIRMGMQSGVIRPEEPEGIPLQETLLSDAFKQCGYRTGLQGKWHLGFYTYHHCPQNRGFDRFYGFYLGAQDYFFHDSGRANEHKYSYENEISGVHNTRFSQGTWGRPWGYDFREAFPGGEENDKILDDTYTNGTYSTKLFVDDFISQLQINSPEEPLFNYVSFQDVHGPLQTVNRFKNLYEDKTDTWTHERIEYSTKVSTLDFHLGRMVDALKQYNYWENTILIFTSDNGGQPREGASNWPLRGSKGTIFDGGLKSRAFIVSPLLQNRIKGEEYKPLFHVSDWFPTLLKLSGCEIPESAGRPLDGKAQELFVHQPKAARNNILHFLDPLVQHDFNDEREFSYLNNRAFNVTIKASYRSGRWKIITGKPCGNGCGYIKSSRNPSYAKDNTKLTDMKKEKNKNVRLYDMWADRGEKFDKSDSKPWMTKKLLEKLADFYDEQVMPQKRKESPNADPDNHGGVWMPWRDTEVFDYTQHSYKNNFSMQQTKCLFEQKSLEQLFISKPTKQELLRSSVNRKSCQ